MNRKPLIWLIIALAVISTGCSSLVKAEQPVVFDSVVLNASQSVGQTFTANFDGMNGIDVYLEPLQTGDGEVQLILRESPQAENFGQFSLPISDISTAGYYHFPLPVLPDSNQQSYYLLLRTRGEGSVEVGSAPGDAYLDGALYQNGRPDDQRQMAFQLSYYVPRLASGFAGEILLWGWYLLVSAFLFVIPGWGILGWLLPRYLQKDPENSDIISQAARNPISKSILSIGVSLSIYPILFVWTDLLGLHLGPWYAWLPPLIGCAYLIWQSALQWRKGNFKLRWPAVQIADLTFVLIIGLIIATRFWVIRSLALPMWGDSYHHSMIVQLLIDNNGLFESWQPYADAATFTYHFGFHAAVSVFHWITHIPAAQATMVIGQIINIFAVIVIYPVAILILKNRWSGILAVLVAGLLSPMPMFYVNWGRYTQLAGQVFLLVAVWFTWIIFQTRKPSWKLLAVTWMVVSSLAMTHYRVVIFYVVFMIAFLILYARKETMISLLKKILWIGSGAGVIFLPWFVNVFGGRILKLFQNSITKMPTTANSSAVSAVSYAIGDLTAYLPITLWLLVILVLGISLWKKKREIAAVGLWWFLLVLVANPHWLNLPGKGIIDNFSVFIAAYIPAGIILAILPEWFSPKLFRVETRKRWAQIIFAIVILMLGIWGAWQRYRVADPLTYALAAEPDVRAAAWIQENIPAEARFLVNTFFAYNNTVMAGSDGGWWLPLIAKRQTSLPPMTSGFESEPLPGYNQWVQAPTRMIEAHGITHPETIATFAEYGITHVYIGQQQGSVNYAGPLQLNPLELQNDPHFEPLYHQDRVWIFEFTP